MIRDVVRHAWRQNRLAVVLAVPAASIAEHGVLQPVKVSPTADGRYLLLWGQRRTLAARQAGLATIPAIVDAAPPAGAQRSVEQLVENLHRADLNPIDRAQAMRAVVDSGISQADLARKLGIAPSTVANDLRLLALDPGVLEGIRTGALSPAHGKAIASLPPKQQRELAKAVVDEKLSAHALESRLKWKQDEAKVDEDRAKRTGKHLPRILAALKAAAVPTDAEVAVSLSQYSFDVAVIQKAIAEAGWTNTTTRYRSKRSTECGCASVHVTTRGAASVIEPTCTNDDHVAKSQKADRAHEEAARKEYEERLAAIRSEIERHLVAAALPLPVLRVLQAALASGYSPDFVTTSEAGAKVIAGDLVRAWRVRELATPELLAELREVTA